MAGKAIGSATSVDLRPGAEALKQLPDATGDASELSATFSKDETAIKNTQVAQNKSRAPEEWTGAAADAASDEIQKLGTKTEQLAEPFRGASAALNEWATNLGSWRDQIKTLQSDWDSAIAKYHKDVAAAGPDPAGQTFISAPGAPVPSNQEAIAEYNRAIKSARRTLHSAQEGFKTTYTGFLEKCSADAQSAANKINAARREVVSDQAGAGGRDAVGASLFLPSELPTVSGVAMWAHAQEVAPEIAEDLKKQPKTVEEVKAFNEKWGDLLGNPFYANALSQYVTVDDIYNASLDALGAGDGRSPRPGSNPGDSVYLFNKNLGTLLAMSTGGTNLSGATAGAQVSFDLMSDHLTGKDGVKVSELVQTKLDQLKEAGWKSYTIPGYPEGVPQYTLQGYDVFGQLAGYAARENPALALGAGFYENPAGGTSVFADMVKWDHDTKAGEVAHLSYAGRAVNMSLIPFDQTDADKGHYDPLQSVFELSDTPDTLEAHNNPLLNQAEEHRLEKFRSALDTNTSFNVGEKPINLVRYLTGSRGASMSNGSVFLDGGEAFGKAISDATAPTEWSGAEDLSDPAYNAWKADAIHRSSIVANLIAGYVDGLDVDHGATDKIGGEDIFGKKNSALRSWMGTILAPHVSDIADNIHDPAKDKDNLVAWGEDPSNGHSKIRLNGYLVERLTGKDGLFQDLAFDRPEVVDNDLAKNSNPLDDQYVGGRLPAIKALQIAAYDGYIDELRRGMQGSDVSSVIDSATNHWSGLICQAYDADLERDIAIGVSEDAANKRIRSVFDAVAGQAIPALAGKIPVAGGIASAAMKAAAGAGEDAFLPINNADEAAKANQSAQATQALNYQLGQQQSGDGNSPSLGTVVQELLQTGVTRAIYESSAWTENGISVHEHPEVLQGELADKCLENGTIRNWTDLSGQDQVWVEGHFANGAYEKSYNDLANNGTLQRVLTELEKK